MCTCVEEGVSASRADDSCAVALSLLNAGLFPCAPKRPTLAIDIDMLDFAWKLFHNTLPNVTGFSTALEEFLSVRQHQLATVVRTNIL